MTLPTHCDVEHAGGTHHPIASECTGLVLVLPGPYPVERWRLPARPASMDGKRLQRVLDRIEAQLASPLPLDELAAEACFSPFHFARLFRKATGTSPHRYVTGRRVQVAKDKLAADGCSLVEIALDTGFGSQANFIRVFRKATGLTPGQYRAQCLHDSKLCTWLRTTCADADPPLA